MRDTQAGVKASRVGNILATSAGALFLQFAVQVLVGWYLNRAYIPDPKHAHDTMVRIMGATPHAQLAGFHYWASLFLIIHSFLHVCAMLFTGWYRPPHHWRWFGSLAFFGCAMLFQITGNLMPFDQHGVQTAAIEGGIAASMPMGQQVAAIIMGGEPAMNAHTLELWYLAHRILIPLGLLLGTLGAVLTHYRKNDTKTNWILAGIITLIPLGISFAAMRPLGTAATEADFNRYGAMVSWYTWPLHGSLEAFNKISPSLGWIGTGVIPALFVGFLLAAPFLSKRLANAGIQFGFVAFLAFFFITGIMFGGSFAPLTGTRDPIVAKGPDEPKPTNVAPIDKLLASRGRDVFNNEGCAGCHGKDGLKATGGPKLDKSFEEHPDAEWFIAFVREPKSKKPSSTMPGFPDLGEEKLKAIAEFLRQPR